MAPRNRITASKRATAAIAAIVAAGIGGMVALFPNEPPVPDDVALAATTLIQPWEGRALKAYRDTIAKPPVWTICDGDTDNVKPRMIETPAGCNHRLAIKITRDYRPKLVACIPGFAKKPISWRAMMDSLAWNIGTGAACGSTAAKLGKAGDYFGSCLAATAFNKAGGRIVIGLVNRREMGDATRIGEAELCVSGVTP
jgi:GH24 family phage-related lysozyme (muramidase)